MVNEINNAHRFFLQVFISKRLLSEAEALEVYYNALKKYAVDAPANNFSSFVYTINKQIEYLYMEIKRGRAEHNGKVFFALVNTVEDSHSKMATDLSPHEMEYVQKIIETLVSSEYRNISSIDILNLGAELGNKIPTAIAEDIVSRLTARGWFTELSGHISFGPRAVIELSHYIKDKFQNQITDCPLCNDCVILGDKCESCEKRYHKYCIATVFQNVDVSDRNCPSCKVCWTNHVISIPKGDNLNKEELMISVEKKKRKK
ncbi:non-structural maintenance of chromosomes element 1 homolog isoform X1 [Hydra vulgaris]|uniref:non-structural maintenance of chromosomes element 1 homolog isoform X1 n=1 Tax=Hydra vulgaris TaxID=6087 RepID=UPI001F5E9361|nr:non-structural maintenance of chromosomes element 1 homolog isoform X1 [Hydra vulgaris]